MGCERRMGSKWLSRYVWSKDQQQPFDLPTHNMSSSKMDPRRPDKIVPFHMPSNVPPSSDYAGNLAVAVGELTLSFFDGGRAIRDAYIDHLVS